MDLLTKEQILAAADRPYEEVSVPEWGGAVRVRSMSGADRDDYEQWMANLNRAGGSLLLPNVRARLVALSAVGGDGARLFAEADIEALGAKSARALDRVFAAAKRVNGIGADEIEALEKNFGGAQSADSTSA